MPMPQMYFLASKEFDAFITDVRDSCLLQTHHQAYHTLRAVLHTFRGYLAPQDALDFANVLPAVARAIFVEDWKLDDKDPAPFPERTVLVAEMKSVRRDHNLAPESAISDVAAALRRSSVDIRALDLVLDRLPAGAREYWDPDFS